MTQESAPSGVRVTLESLGVAGAPVLASLHAAAFETGWDAPAFVQLLGQPGTQAVVACGSEPLGFILFRVAADEAEILSLATRPEARRRGVATALLADATRRLARMGVRRFVLEVAVGNAAARALYSRFGFETVANRGSYYARPRAAGEDALVLAHAIAAGGR